MQSKFESFRNFCVNSIEVTVISFWVHTRMKLWLQSEASLRNITNLGSIEYKGLRCPLCPPISSWFCFICDLTMDTVTLWSGFLVSKPNSFYFCSINAFKVQLGGRFVLSTHILTISFFILLKFLLFCLIAALVVPFFRPDFGTDFNCSRVLFW